MYIAKIGLFNIFKCRFGDVCIYLCFGNVIVIVIEGRRFSALINKLNPNLVTWFVSPLESIVIPLLQYL